MRERFSSERARFTGRLQSFLAQDARRREERRLANEAGHVVDTIPIDQEIVLFPQVRECADTRWVEEVAQTNEIYNQSISLEEDKRLNID